MVGMVNWWGWSTVRDGEGQLVGMVTWWGWGGQQVEWDGQLVGIANWLA